MPKCHASKDHACDQLELLKGLADFCEDWVEQLHQLGLKNNIEKYRKKNKSTRNGSGICRIRRMLIHQQLFCYKRIIIAKLCTPTRQLAMDWGESTIKSRGDYKARCVR
jgi:hypothetical protein